MTIAQGIRTDLDNEAYHALTEWLSSSQLKALLPEHYKAGGSQQALDFGTLFHTAVLEPDNLTEYVALDENKIGLKADGTVAQNPTMTSAWKKAVAEAEADGKTVIAQGDLDKALAMRDAVWKHEAARQLLDSCIAFEESAFWVDEHGVQHKARFDGRGPGFALDLKSTSSKPGVHSLRRAVWDYGYHVSAVHYMEVANGLGLDVPTFALIFCGKEPVNGTYPVTVAQLSDDRLSEGRELRTEAIRRHTDPTADAYPGATGFITL